MTLHTSYANLKQPLISDSLSTTFVHLTFQLFLDSKSGIKISKIQQPPKLHIHVKSAQAMSRDLKHNDFYVKAICPKKQHQET